jgi:transposase-like protein
MQRSASSTNPLERLSAEIKHRTDVVGIMPNEPAITVLIGALLLEAKRRVATAAPLHVA